MSAASVRLPMWAQTVASLAGTPAAGPLLLGVDYYPDQTPEALWEEDARMMAEFGFTNVRIAEFAWALMEPAEGKFDFAWLRRSIDILNKHNIAVILGTPSAAPPPWLTCQVSGHCRSQREGRAATSRRTAIYLSYKPGLSAAVVDHCHRNGQDVCRYAGRDRLADRQRIYPGLIAALLL